MSFKVKTYLKRDGVSRYPDPFTFKFCNSVDYTTTSNKFVIGIGYNHDN